MRWPRLAVVQPQLAPRARRVLQVVGHHHQGLALGVERFEQGEHLAAGLAVEVAGGLVGQQQRRAHDHSAGDGHPLTLAAGQLGRAMAQALTEAEAFGQLAAATAALGGVDAGQEHRQLDVFQHVQPRDQVVGLEHETDMAAA